MLIRDVVLRTIIEVAAEHNIALAALRDDLPLLESNLDSLSLAVIVAKLEDELGEDPLQETDDTNFPVTVGDLIKLYENAAAA